MDNSSRPPGYGQRYPNGPAVDMKLPIREQIPKSFANFMREVDQHIRSADPCAITPSDDLLQTDDAYGGRLDDDSMSFGFTYFPDSNHDGPFPPKWQLILSATQISDIACGKLSALDMWKCASDCGSRGTEPDYYCSRCG